MRPIRKNEIRFEGDKVQFHGAAQRLLKRLARQFSRREGHTVTPDQVAERLVAGVQKAVGLHADLARMLDKMRKTLQQFRGKGGPQ